MSRYSVRSRVTAAHAAWPVLPFADKAGKGPPCRRPKDSPSPERLLLIGERPRDRSHRSGHLRGKFPRCRTFDIRRYCKRESPENTGKMVTPLVPFAKTGALTDTEK